MLSSTCKCGQDVLGKVKNSGPCLQRILSTNCNEVKPSVAISAGFIFDGTDNKFPASINSNTLTKPCWTLCLYTFFILFIHHKTTEKSVQK